MFVVHVWVWEGVHEVVLPRDHDDRRVVVAVQVKLCSGRRYYKGQSISGIMMAVHKVGCNNATGRSAHGLALLSLLRARFGILVCPANTYNSPNIISVDVESNCLGFNFLLDGEREAELAMADKIYKWRRAPRPGQNF